MSRRKQSKPKSVKDEHSETVGEYEDSAERDDASESKLKKSREMSFAERRADKRKVKESLNETKIGVSDKKTKNSSEDTSLLPTSTEPSLESMKCQFCIRSFTSITSLQLHTLKQHVTSTPEDRMMLLSSSDLPEIITTSRFLECQHCSSVFPNLTSFAMHMRQHLSSDLGPDLLILSSGHNQDLTDSPSVSTPGVNNSDPVSDVPPCSKCSKPFTDNLTRLSHIITHYEVTMKRHSCTECRSIFASSSELLQHLIDRHLAIQYICTICNCALDNQKSYQEHCLQHSREAISYKCNSCPLSFEAREMLAIHVQYVHDSYRDHEPFEPHSIGERTARIFSQHPLNRLANTDYQWNTDITGERDSRPLQCSVCDERCSGEDALDEHRLFSHCKVLHSEVCAECSEPLRNCEDFEHHTRLHVRDMYMSCAVCRQSLRSESQLKLHSKFHMTTQKSTILHPSTQPSEFTEEKRCEICAKTLISNNQLLLHLLEHDGQKCCPYCELNFNLAHHLLNHICQEHSKEKALYTCEICLEVYHFRIQLEHHRISHVHDVEPSDSHKSNSLSGIQTSKHSVETSAQRSKDSARMRCPVCGISFNKGPRYENHIKKHVNINCCVCQICEESFGRRDELEQHMMVHKGNLELGISTQPDSRLLK